MSERENITALDIQYILRHCDNGDFEEILFRYADKRTLRTLLAASILLAATYASNVRPVFANHVVFTFASAGDIGNFMENTVDNHLAAVQAGLNSVSDLNPAFFLALGDHSYNGNEQSWCNTWLSGTGNPGGKHFRRLVLATGDEEAGEPLEGLRNGNINNFITHCDVPDAEFSLPNFQSTPDKTTASDQAKGCTWPNPTVQCYGKEYYFDYPAAPASPLVRFIVTTPQVGWDQKVKFHDTINPTANPPVWDPGEAVILDNNWNAKYDAGG